MKAALLALSTLAGCSQILGLEDTKFEGRDGAVDAPSVCDASPRCISSTDRSVCGQLYGTGTAAGDLLRAAEPTGDTCANLNSTAGPCAYTVSAQSLVDYYAENGVTRIAGEIDDCGRFVVADVDRTAQDVAVVFSGTDIVESVTLVLDRDSTVGEDRNVVAPIVQISTANSWAMQVDTANPPTVTAGYLITYINPSGLPIAMQELRINGGAVGDPPTVPWGAYFTDDVPYGTIDPAATTTGASGSALVVPSSSPFMLGGFRPGKNCTAVPVEPHANAFIHVALSC